MPARSGGPSSGLSRPAGSTLPLMSARQVSTRGRWLVGSWLAGSWSSCPEAATQQNATEWAADTTDVRCLTVGRLESKGKVSAGLVPRDPPWLADGCFVLVPTWPFL